MMRSPNHMSVACRAPNGEIIMKTEPLERHWLFRQRWLKLPFLRGTLAILDSLVIGNKALRFAGEVQIDPANQPQTAEGAAAPVAKQPSKEATGITIMVAVVAGLVLGFLIFNALPNFVAESLRFAGVKNGTTINYAAEIIKAFIFIGYIWGISFLPDIRELFRYHGAEHKAINALEADQVLTTENCLKQTRIHPRCGTSFAIIVLLVGFIFFPLVPRYPITGTQGKFFVDVPVRLALELMILPIIAGISYELLRLAGKLRDQKIVMAAFAPGMWTQRITTKEPNEKHVEVALVALKEVLKAEGELPTEEALAH